jgi:membrane protease subunit (stomatin/prohibitin family)
MAEIVGTDGAFTTAEIEFQIRNIIVTHFSQIIASAGIPVLDMAANTVELAKLVHARIAPMVAEYGLELPMFMIENVSLPAEVEAALDRRTASGMVGDLGKYAEFSAAEALTRSAGAEGGGAIGAGLGAGMGMAMAERMARGPWGQAPAATHPAAAAPPPPPQEPPARVWHIARDGAAQGPFSEAELALKASTGEITPDTYLWTPGGPDWRRGRDVGELADLFSAPPPPPG